MSEMAPFLAGKDEEKNSGDEESESSDVDDWEMPLCYDQPRHLEPIRGLERAEHSWRVKEKYKTHCVALVLCLNVGVDPPDVVKTQPCARLECWIDPNSLSPSKALESIGHALQAQYERWQPRARYKQSLDPTSDEVKKLCCSLRRNAKDERVLFHYNGHGVPKPTAQGEIWVFNRAYTQYIPLSMYDLQTWMGAPSLYVYDCSNAGVILDNFKQFAEQHERDYEMALAGKGDGAAGQPPPPAVSYKNCIQLGACAAGQSLPMNPELPADLFTACLTTPVKMAMKWFVLRHRTRLARPDLVELVDKIPGQVTDRRTMLGELNWIFTAITDTIAWSSLPAELFQQLFRADLLTASLCRNYLLADRIMRSYNCTPVCQPALPSLAAHPLWAAWEQTLDLALAQLPALLERGAEYRHSAFFRDQLTAFEVWLALGKWSPARGPPEQLPMVLQVLLSTLHRVRALQILCRFLALGEWAVRAVLHVGIFPYMLKLLQASAHDLRASMVYIWAKIVAVDPSCQVDLVNAKGHKYFLSVLQDPTVESCYRTMAAYVLAGIVDGHGPGQQAALQGSMISACLEQLGDGEGDARLVQWACLALGRLWRGYDAARWAGVRDLAHEKLYPLLRHVRPEVRAACAFALGAFMSAGAASGARSEQANALDQQVALHLANHVPAEASPLVRAEIVAALQWPVLIFEQHFIAVYLQERLRRSDRDGGPGGAAPPVDRGQDALEPRGAGVGLGPTVRAHAALALPTIGFGSVYAKLWHTLTGLAREPHPLVARLAGDVVEFVAEQVDSVGRDRDSASLPPSPLGRVERARRLPHAASDEPVQPKDRHDSAPGPVKRAIVSTSFAEWASAAFVCDLGPPHEDVESRAHHERLWRRTRNASLRRDAKKLVGLRVQRLETQAFHSRCPLPPAAVLLHPYDQHVAVAFKDNFGVWDWGTGAKLCVGAWRRQWGRISALEYVNAHATALLGVASASGHVALYRPGASAHEPALLAAWRALDARPAPDYRPPPAQPLYGAGANAASAEPALAAPPPTLLRWSPASATLALAGNAPLVRLWDARTELLLRDIATESEAGATAMWRGGALLACGFGDGAVRCWDERAPAPLHALHDHSAALLCCARRPDRHLLVTVCAAGQVRLYDTRRLRPCASAAAIAPAPLAAADVHPLADVLACGSLNQCIGVFDLRGSPLNTVKFHEGFMGARLGPVSCLSFHALRVALGVGAKDSTVSVYVAEARR